MAKAKTTKKPEAKRPKTKAKMGRPTAYNPVFVKQAKKLCLLGATDQELADFFEVTCRTVHRWKIEHADFCHAITIGKAEPDSRVVRSLYQQAVGYEQDEVKIFMPANSAEPVYAPYRAKIAPSATAAIFWLKNRDKDNWRDKIEQGFTDGQGKDVQPQVTVRFVKANED